MVGIRDMEGKDVREEGRGIGNNSDRKMETSLKKKEEGVVS